MIYRYISKCGNFETFGWFCVKKNPEMRWDSLKLAEFKPKDKD